MAINLIGLQRRRQCMRYVCIRSMRVSCQRAGCWQAIADWLGRTAAVLCAACSVPRRDAVHHVGA